MAVRTWLDTDGNWNNTANWSAGTVPISGDTAIIADGSQSITTNVTQNTVDLAKLKIGRGFKGQIGTASVPLYFGAVSTSYEVEAPEAIEIHLRVTTCPLLIVKGCRATTYGLYLFGGTWTDCYFLAGQGIRVGSSTLTTSYLGWLANQLEDVLVNIESGATMTTIQQLGGRIRSQAALVTVNQYHGQLWQEGDSTNNITTLNQYGAGATAYLNGKGMTITTLNGFAGVADFRQDNDAKTCTTSNTYRGHRLIDNAVDTITHSTLNIRGGDYQGKQTPTTNIVAIPR